MLEVEAQMSPSTAKKAGSGGADASEYGKEGAPSEGMPTLGTSCASVTDLQREFAPASQIGVPTIGSEGSIGVPTLADLERTAAAER